MRAVQFAAFGDYDVLDLVTAPDPKPANGDAVVRMTVAGVSPLDNTVRLGKLPAVKPLPLIAGNSGVGVVEDPGDSALARGTRVVVAGGGYGVRADGTWAELIAVDPALLVAVPDAVDDVAAAALTTGAGYSTAYLALTDVIGFRAGQTVLAPGVGGSVGQGGVEIARVLGASKSITTATSTSKAERGRAAGFEVIDLTQESLREGVARLTGGAGVDVVLDGVGGDVTGEAIGALAVDGALVSIGYAAGMRTSVNVTDLIWKNAHVHGFRFALFTPEQIRANNATLLELLAAKEITPLVDSVFPLTEAAIAQRHLIEGGPFGRVLLTV